MKKKNILIACESSGTIREAFNIRGHNAMSCDLLDTDIPGNHHKGDVLPLLKMKWDLIVAHPPCTFLCNSGVRWLVKNGVIQTDRYEEMIKAAIFFKEFLKYDGRVIIENPIPHKYALHQIGVKYSQIIQPWMFGHGETKATCFWLKGVKLIRA